MTVDTRQLAHCAQRSQGFFGKFRHGEISELARHLASIQLKAQVRGREARSNGIRLLLDVIRDQPMMLGRIKFFEISPCAEGSLTQEELFLAGRFCRGRHRWLIQPDRNQLAASPECEDWCWCPECI